MVKPALGVLAFAVLVAMVASSCWVSTRSGEFACSSDTDCDGFTSPNRYCDLGLGYCVPEPCPDECDSCDTSAKTCAISCTTSDSCSFVDCPDGYDCTIACSGMGACGTVNCRDAAACTITCSGGNNANNRPCDRVECGDGPCDVTCSGFGCRDVDCNNSCDCPVTCTGNDSCGVSATCSVGCGNGPNGGCSPCNNC